MEGIAAGIKYCDETNLKAEAELVAFFRNAGLKVYEADVDAFSTHVLDLYLNQISPRPGTSPCLKKSRQPPNKSFFNRLRECRATGIPVSRLQINTPARGCQYEKNPARDKASL